MKFRDYDKMLERALKELPEMKFDEKRFEIPEPRVFIQGSRTEIKNFSEITAMLARPPQHLLKYLSKELGTLGNLQKNRAIFQGKFNFYKVKEAMDSYMKDFVLCKECGKPDTKMEREDRITFVKCLACGAKYPVRNL